MSPLRQKYFSPKNLLISMMTTAIVTSIFPIARLYAQPVPMPPQRVNNNSAQPAVLPYNNTVAPPPLQGNVSQQGLQGINNQYATGAQDERENILIILDASYSMAEPISKNFSKMAAAKRTVLQTLQKIPANRPVGLRVYGQSRIEYNSCRATKLLVPIGFNNREGISRELMNVEPTGATPISFALQTALSQDFTGVQGKKSIVLVSDGIETCSVDPCAIAVKMMQSGADVKINVVGYGLQDYDAEKQLRCVALATKGKYYNAHTEAQLANSLDELFKSSKTVEAKVFTQPSAQPQIQPEVPMDPRLQKHLVH